MTVAIDFPSTVLFGFLLAFLVIFVYFEVTDLYIMKLKTYFSVLWNLADLTRIGFVAAYLYLSAIADREGEATTNRIRTLAVVFAWFICLRSFTIFKQTRYLNRLIFETTKGMIPFMIIFLYTIFVLSLAIMSLHDDSFIDSWQQSYRMAFGDFEDEYAEHRDRIVFFFGTLALPLIMLNLLISIMGDKYDQV